VRCLPIQIIERLFTDATGGILRWRRTRIDRRVRGAFRALFRSGFPIADARPLLF
jgi:hypothetical protein